MGNEIRAKAKAKPPRKLAGEKRGSDGRFQPGHLQAIREPLNRCLGKFADLVPTNQADSDDDPDRPTDDERLRVKAEALAEIATERLSRENARLHEANIRLAQRVDQLESAARPEATA